MQSFNSGLELPYLGSLEQPPWLGTSDLQTAEHVEPWKLQFHRKSPNSARKDLLFAWNQSAELHSWVGLRLLVGFATGPQALENHTTPWAQRDQAPIAQLECVSSLKTRVLLISLSLLILRKSRKVWPVIGLYFSWNRFSLGLLRWLNPNYEQYLETRGQNLWTLRTDWWQSCTERSIALHLFMQNKNYFWII